MEQLVNFIIRPPRAEYHPELAILDQEFMLRGKCFQRKDVEIKNSRGDVLQGTHYVPVVSPEEKPLPCVIYCHGNSGCRSDASEAAIILLPSNITVFTLDFSGSGLSGGEHVTLGWYEKDDLKAVVDYLRQDENVALIGLWGRSMGAVSSLMYGAEDPSIAGMVLDSPFSDLVDLMMELVDTYKFRSPMFTVKFAIQYMKRAIQKKAKFDITRLNTIKVAQSCFVPALFGHAIDDDFIQPHHSDRIHEAYMGDKYIIKFEGDHNSQRPQFYFDCINIFYHNVLHPPEDQVGQTYLDPMTNYFGKDSWCTTREVGHNLDFSVVSKGPSSSNGEDANKQVRPKRPMSRMEVPSDIPSNSNQSEAEAGEVHDNHLPSSLSDMISFKLSDDVNGRSNRIVKRLGNPLNQKNRPESTRLPIMIPKKNVIFQKKLLNMNLQRQKVLPLSCSTGEFRKSNTHHLIQPEHHLTLHIDSRTEPGKPHYGWFVAQVGFQLVPEQSVKWVFWFQEHNDLFCNYDCSSG